MNRSIRVALGLLVALVGLTLVCAVAVHAVQERFAVFGYACRRLWAWGAQLQAASRLSVMPGASVSRPA